MTRTIRQPDSIAVQAVVVTQENCASVLGIDPRRYLERIIPLCAGHVAQLGRLRAIPVSIVLQKLREIARTAAGGELTPAVAADDELQSVDDVLRALGMRRTG